MEEQTIRTYEYHELPRDGAKRRAFAVAWMDALEQRSDIVNTMFLNALKKVFTKEGFGGEVRRLGRWHTTEGYFLRVAFEPSDEVRHKLFEKRKADNHFDYWMQLTGELLKMPNDATVYFDVVLKDVGVVSSISIHGYIGSGYFDAEEKLYEAKRLFGEIVDNLLHVLYKTITSEDYFVLACTMSFVRFTEDGWPLKNLETVKLPTYEEFKVWLESK